MMRQDSPYSVDARSAPGSAQVIQYGFSDRWLIIVLIVVTVLALIFAVFALVRSSDAVATQANLTGQIAKTEADHAAQVRTLAARIEVLQYDHQALKGQLVAKGIYEGTEH